MEPATSGHHCSPLLDDRQFPIDVRFIIAISTVWAFSQIPASVAMDALQYSSEAWNAVTVVMHLLAVIILIFCLVRRRFFRIVPRQLLPTSQLFQLGSCTGSDSNRLPGPERRPSAGTMDTLRKPLGWFRRLWRTLIAPRYTLDTTCARFSMFLTLLTSLLFVTSTFITVAGVGLNSDPVPYVAQNQHPNVTTLLESFIPGLPMGCRALEYVCIVSYGSTKVCMYWFLIERVYIVSYSGTVSRLPRLTTRTYKAGIAGLIIYVTIVILLLLGQMTSLAPAVYQSSVSQDTITVFVVGICTVGLRVYGALPILVYETVITIVLTAMFIIPIATSGRARQRKPWLQILSEKLKRFCNPSSTPATPFFNLTALFPNIEYPLPPLGNAISSTTTRRTTELPIRDTNDQFTSTIGLSSFGLDTDTEHQSLELRSLAKRSLVWSLAGLVVAFANIFLLALRGGEREGGMCIRWCVADVVINALAVFMVMGGKDEWCMRSASVQRPGMAHRDVRLQGDYSSRMERGRRAIIGLETSSLTAPVVRLSAASPEVLPDVSISPLTLPSPVRNLPRRSRCISLDAHSIQALRPSLNSVINFGKQAVKQADRPSTTVPEELHLRPASHRSALSLPSTWVEHTHPKQRWSSEELQLHIGL